MSADTAFEVGRLFAPISAIADVLVASQKDLFIRLPALQAYFPMSITDELGKARDHAGGVDLFMVGTVTVGYDGNSFRQLGGGTNFLQVFSTVYDLSGTESFVDPAIRGITVGGWFEVDVLPSLFSGIISKDGASPQRGYALQFSPTGDVAFTVSGNGTTTSDVTLTGPPINQWRFVVGRYIPSVEVAVIVDGVKVTNSTSIPSSCWASTQAFEIGRFFNDNNRVLDAKCRDVFICRSALSDELIEQLRLSSAP